MGFGEAIASGFSNYVGFTGRAQRSAYWFWALFEVLVLVAALVIDAVIGVSILYPLGALALFLPSLAVGVRRLHDLDKSGWWLLIGLIPLVGGIILLVWFCSRGTVGGNRFGSDPLEGKVI
jgi:uncharacterized membrane protein YhaH (DUF805 family)